MCGGPKAKVVERVDWIVWRRERRGGGRLFGGTDVIFDMERSSCLGVGEVFLSRFVGGGSGFGDRLRLTLVCESASDGNSIVSIGSSLERGFSSDGSSFAGGSCFGVLWSSLSDGSDAGVIGVGKLL